MGLSGRMLYFLTKFVFKLKRTWEGTFGKTKIINNAPFPALPKIVKLS